MADMMVDRAQHWADRLMNYADTDKAIDISPEMTALTLDVISKAIFSSGVEEKADMVGEQITLLNEYAIVKLNQPFRLPPMIPTPFNVRERKAIKL
jgi:cytochrome P450